MSNVPEIVAVNNKPRFVPDFQQATEALNNAKEEFISSGVQPTHSKAIEVNKSDSYFLVILLLH